MAACSASCCGVRSVASLTPPPAPPPPRPPRCPVNPATANNAAPPPRRPVGAARNPGLNSRFNTHVPESLAARSEAETFCALTMAWESTSVIPPTARTAIALKPLVIERLLTWSLEDSTIIAQDGGDGGHGTSLNTEARGHGVLKTRKFPRLRVSVLILSRALRPLRRQASPHRQKKRGEPKPTPLDRPKTDSL